MDGTRYEMLSRQSEMLSSRFLCLTRLSLLRFSFRELALPAYESPSRVRGILESRYECPATRCLILTHTMEMRFQRYE